MEGDLNIEKDIFWLLYEGKVSGQASLTNFDFQEGVMYQEAQIINLADKNQNIDPNSSTPIDKPVDPFPGD